MSEAASTFYDQPAPEPARLVLEVPMATPSANAWAGRYSRWGYRREKLRWVRLLTDAYHLARAQRPLAAFTWPCPPRWRVRCTVERITPRADALDLDNALGGVKPALDAMRGLRLLADDSMRQLDLVVQQPKGAPHQRMTRFTLEEIR